MPDQFLLIRIEGMHCHRCQQAIQRALHARDGVFEAEVDFPTRQASVLYDPGKVNVRELMDVIADAGYRATGFMQGQEAHQASSVEPG
jgi:copper chaperone CopZ